MNGNATVNANRRTDSRATEQLFGRDIRANSFDDYRNRIMHQWLRTLTLLATVLVPLFFVLDVFTMPANLIVRFAAYRGISTFLALAQLVVVRCTSPGPLSHVHGYFLSVQIGTVIALMTADLGGFGSSYYAGLNLVIIGVNLLMPWRAFHTGINVSIILGLYIFVNLGYGQVVDPKSFVNNLFFLCSTGIVSVCISLVRYRLIRNEFSLLVELEKARDALWSEMELAKRIQTALLPLKQDLKGYQVAVTMQPAKEVGGDYYDIIETENGARWIAIGDVAGHGVDSGLIMMMAQASVMTVIKGEKKVDPVDVLRKVNLVIREEITRLGSSHYMTMMVIRIDDALMSIAGHHQDILLYDSRERKVVAIPTNGTWIGIADEIKSFTQIRTIELEENDSVLLFTDGVTEGENDKGEMYGQERLMRIFGSHAEERVEDCLDLILKDVKEFQSEQKDDITLMLLKKTR